MWHRIVVFLEALGEVFASGAIGVVSDLVNILVIILTMFTLQWQLALLLVLMLFPVTALIIFFQKQYRIANYQVREELSKLNAQLQENVVGVNIVQLFRRERFNAEMFRAINTQYRQSLDKTIFYDSAVSATLEWIGLIAVAGVLWLGGILIRTLAPLLTNKWQEPPVLAIAEDGSAVVPLLGGLQGVNDLARQIASVWQISPAITTTGDIRFKTTLLSPPPGYQLVNPDDAKKFLADLLAGEKVKLIGKADWLKNSNLPISSTAARH